MLVETRCGRLFVDVRGEGPPLVLWPSLLTDGRMWDAQVSALEAKYRVVAIDPPGHGRSGPPPVFTMDDSVNAALGVLDALSIPRCRWAGLSWGGMVGMRLAIRTPERIEKLALLDTNADAETPSKLPSYRVMAFLEKHFGAFPLLLDRLEPIFFSPATRRDRPEVVKAFRERLAAMDPVAVSRAVDAVIFTRNDVRPELHRITAPTLVVCGEDDVATPLARSFDIHARIPGSKMIRVKDAGHLSAWEQPGAVTAALSSFFA
jgi:3-oxoadipate enol-lactonase